MPNVQAGRHDPSRLASALAALSVGAMTVPADDGTPATMTPRADSSCWTCGKLREEGAKLQACPQCRKLGIEPLYFCDKQCLAASWKRHKAWHKEQFLELARAHEELAYAQERATSIEELAADKEKVANTPYKALVAEAITQVQIFANDGGLRRAEAKLREAIRTAPRRRDAHNLLAQVLDRLHSEVEAFSEYLLTMELSISQDEMWARAVVRCFELLHMSRNDLPHPPWWKDETLLKMADEVRGLLPPDVWQGNRMRAMVLGGSVQSKVRWVEKLQRDRQDLEQAAEIFQELANHTVAAINGDADAAADLAQFTEEALRTRQKDYILRGCRCRAVASTLPPCRAAVVDQSVLDRVDAHPC